MFARRVGAAQLSASRLVRASVSLQGQSAVALFERARRIVILSQQAGECNVSVSISRLEPQVLAISGDGAGVVSLLLEGLGQSESSFGKA